MELKNDKEYICSLSGKPCKCSTGQGCGRGIVDPCAGEAIQWAKAAAYRLTDASEALTLALKQLSRYRPYPAPEWRETQRLIHAAKKLLEETL